MGNRAVITKLGSEKGIYLHWNGGMDSVKPIVWFAKHFIFDMEELDAINFVAKCWGLDPDYRNASELDCNNYDNGVYIVNNGVIIGRVYAPSKEQDSYDFDEMVDSLNSAMPKNYRKSREFVLKYLASESLKDEWGNIDKEKFRDKVHIGSEVLVHEWNGDAFFKLLGVRKSHELVNGEDRYGKYYFNFTKLNKYQSPWDDADERLEGNPNSYYDPSDKEDVRVVNEERYKELLAKSKGWDD